MSINLQKILFHTLTNQNGEVSYYGEVYLKKCGNWAGSKPVTFAKNLLKLRFHYGILKRSSPLRLAGMKNDRIDLSYYRLKLTQSMKVMLDYRHIITDMWGSLLQPVLSEEALFIQLEKNLGVDGFAAARKKYDDTRVPIDEIYKKISVELNTPIFSEYEIKLVSDSVLINYFVLDNLDTAVANQTEVTAIIDSSYPKEMFEEILKKHSINCISEIIVTSQNNKKISRLISEYIKKYKRQEKGYDKNVRIYASDYDKYILRQRRKGNTASYYTPPEFFLKRNNIPEFTSPFGGLYRHIEGNLNYSRPFSRSDEYQTAVLYIAPVAYGFLYEVFKRAGKRQVVFLGSADHILVQLYRKYFGDASDIEWSYIAANKPRYSLEWEMIFQKMPILDKIPADRVASVFGFSAPSYKIERVRNEFVDGWIDSSRDGHIRKDDGVVEYVKSFLQDKESVLLVDITENSEGGMSFVHRIKELGIELDYEYLSLRSYFTDNGIEKGIQERTERTFHGLFQMELPVLLKIDKDTLSFAQAPMLPIQEKEKMYGGINEYFRIMKEIDIDNKLPSISAYEMADLLLAGESSIQRLERRFME